MNINIFHKTGIVALVALMAFVVLSTYQQRGTTLTAPEKQPQEKSHEVQVLTTLAPEVAEVIFRRFTEETGVVVHYRSGRIQELIARYDTEKSLVSADMLICARMAELWLAKEHHMLQSFSSPALRKVPADYHDTMLMWYGFASRIQPIFYAKNRVEPEEALSSYEELADPKWRGKILLPSFREDASSLLLLSAMVERLGVEGAVKWTMGMVKNTARKPAGTGRDALRALATGRGDIALASSADYLQMQHSAEEEERRLAGNIGVFLPRGGGGVVADMATVAMIRRAPNHNNAQKLSEFLYQPEIQALYGAESFDFPLLAPGSGVALQKEKNAAWKDAASAFLREKKQGNIQKYKEDAALIAVQQGWK